LIARNGLEAVTVREIAREAGYSTAVVSHYFRNKHDLLLFVYRMMMEKTVARVEDVLQKGGTIQECLEAILPLDDEQRDSWQVWFAFWGKTANDAEFRLEQQQRGREARVLFKRVLTGALDAKRRSSQEIDMQSRRLLAVVTGLATQGTFDPEEWTKECQKAVLAQAIATVG